MPAPDRRLAERNARIAYEVVMTRRYLDLFEAREAYVSFHLRAIHDLVARHGEVVPVDFHVRTVLFHTFGFDRPEAAS
jgi:hypothetical protein